MAARARVKTSSSGIASAVQRPAQRRWSLPLMTLFALTILLSAALLFMVQPLVGRVLLPVLGGSPAVWSSCIVFFQAVLLLGYLYAHVLSTRVPRRWQWLVHAAVLIVASVTLPLPIDVGEPGDANPRWWVLRALTITAGVPFFALAATAPLLQQWFSRTDDPRASDPYFLYAASNAGSLLGLLAYILLEPIAPRSLQVTGWAVGFWTVAALIGLCAYEGVARSLPPPADATRRSIAIIPLFERALWIALALVPAALLVAVTQHLATDVVSAPLLWVLPLALYLGTFIAAFSTRRVGGAARWGTIAPSAALLVLVVSLAEVRYPILLVTLVHLAAFTALVMLCHTRLAERRPDGAHLTGYFVCVSLGGMLGGVAAALVAPAVFSSVREYPLAIAAAVLLRPQTLHVAGWARSRAGRIVWGATAAMLLVVGYWCVSAFDDAANTNRMKTTPLFGAVRSLAGDDETVHRVLRASLAIPAGLLLLMPRTALLFAATSAGLLVAAGPVRTGGQLLARERSFFGVHQVSAVEGGEWHVLTHGTTTHGVQAVRGRMHALPTAYYHPSGPIGDVVFTLVPDGRFRNVAVVGLGAGALAAYAGSGVRLDFFEIDQAVIDIAENPHYFAYLADARTRPGVTVRTVAADGRLGLRAMPAASYDLIVIDAFSSDAIPTHLITREAVALYQSRLEPRGVIAFHVSNRFFDLPPVLASIAADRGLVAYARHDDQVPPDKAAEAMRASVWVVLARNENDLGQLAHVAPRWTRLVSDPGRPVWTDDYSNVLGALLK